MNVLPLNALGGVFGEKPTHARLRLAKEKLGAAKLALIAKRADLDRLNSVVSSADQAARAASDALHTLAAFRTRWAREGCRYSEAAELQRLERLAAEASTLAEHATKNADAVRPQLRRAESELNSKAGAIAGAEDEITAAISVIAAENANALLNRFEKIAAEYRTTRAEVIALRDVLTRPWSLDTKNSMDPSIEGLTVIEAALQRSRIKSFDDELEEPRARDHLKGTREVEDWLDGLKEPWRALMAELRNE